MKALLAVIIIASLFVGWGIGELTLKPVAEASTITIYVDKVVEVPVEKIVYQEVTVIKEVPVYQEKIVEVPVQLADFESLGELQAFVDSWSVLILQPNICVELAELMRNAAMAKGKFLSIQLVNDNTHAVCMAIVGKGIYYIEPATKSIWLVSLRGDR
jgi:hypothetical protein